MVRLYNRIIRHLKFKSIQSHIAVAFSLLILFTILIIAIVSYSLSYEAVKRNSQEYTYQLIEQVNTNIDAYIASMESISLIAQYNSDVIAYLSRENFKSLDEKMNYETKIAQLFNSMLSFRKDIVSIMVFGYNGRVLISDRRNYVKLNEYIDIREQDWYRRAREANGSAVVSSSHVQNILRDGSYRWVVSLSREFTRGKDKLGILLVDLNYNVINDMLSKIKLGKRGYIFIIDREGNIVYHPQQQLIYSNVKKEMIDEVLNTKESSFITNEGENSRIYSIRESAHTGWKIVGVTYTNELVLNKNEIRNSYVALGFLCLIIAIMLSVVISSRISRPVRLLEASMKQVENGDFDIRVDIQSSNEIGELSRAFNIMIAKIKELMHQNIKEQELKRKSELKALQAQINPHFLYNTLDSIVWMAEGKKSEEVVLMTSALAKLFRISISKGEEIITIRNEIEHVNSYLTIQKMRYRDKLDFDIDVDKDILNYKTLKIVLQPLVENSIYHGIKNKTGTGFIRIKGSREGNRILLQVIDNGVGIHPEKLKHLLDKPVESPKGSGVGVANVNERIKLYYGEEYGLEFESELEVGTTVKIWLPVVE